MTITFTLPGQPQGKGRPRVGKIAGHASLYTPAKTAAYEGLVAHAAHQAMAGQPLFTGAVSVSMLLTCQIPASWSGKKQRLALAGEVLPTTKPDIDNVVKAVFDGCNGVLWRDDVQAVDLLVRKRYGATPSVKVTAWPMAGRGSEETELPF